MPAPEDSNESSISKREGSGLPVVPPDVVEQEFQEEIDNPVPTRGYQMVPLVGLGGSAGSIQALQKFLENIPSDSGVAYVVILHLSPHRDSTLAELLQRSSKVPVVQAQDHEKLVTNHVYVIPPGKHLTIMEGRFRLTELKSERERRYTIDVFLRSLADTYGPHSVGIIFSGADGDGQLGIKRIKERGGLTIAQDPDEAEHPSMPSAAIATGMVDWVLQAAEMPQRILEYWATERRLEVPPEEGPQPARPIVPTTDADELALREVLLFLRTRTGRDFSYYKRATIVRRVSRRLQVNGLDNLPTYLSYLRTHPGEASALLQDLLISVTNFFRDRDAFESLEERIPELFKGKGQSDTIRVWVPACASGEEAYSIAILILEYARRLDVAPAIQIFGCDLDEDAIQIARAGLYPDTISADVSEERLRRFFTKEHLGYRVRREVREMVLFAVHDILKDPPFSRLDLISCRNLFIYLNREAQTRVLEIFNFALRPESLLFLGSSESIDEDCPFFPILNKKHRIYTHRVLGRPGLPMSLGASTLLRTIETQKHLTASPVVPLSAFSQAAGLPFTSPPGSVENRLSIGELHFRLIERFAPPSLVVNQDHDIMHLSESAGHFLQLSGGEPNMNLLRVVHPALRIELRAALFRAAETGLPVDVFGIPAEIGGAPRLVDIRVASAPDLAPGYLLVTFDALEPGSISERKAPQAEADPVAQHLERALEQVKSHLRDTVEQYEASTEELKASNEELQAMNEELRSATEELETSREELQSINEELTTVNQELKGKVDELGHANSDLHNLMSATAIATIFLDRDRRIMRFTPSAVPIFHLIPSDIGRPLSDLQHRLAYPELSADAERVLSELIPIEREVREADGRCFIARLLPYRTVEDRIAGVVLTLVDITERKRAEEALAQSEERLRLVVENASEFAIFAMDLDLRVTIWNSGAERILGYRETEIIGQNAGLLFVPEDRRTGAPEQEVRTALAEGRADDERWHLRKDGNRFWGSGFLMSMRDAGGTVIGFVKILHDRTTAKQAEEALVRSSAELEKALAEAESARHEAETAGRTKDRFLAMLSHELRTPLTPVLMATESMLRRKDLPPGVVDALETIRRNIELETRFINDLLDISRISHGKFELECAPLGLHEVIRRALEIAKPDDEAKQQRLAVDLLAAHDLVLGDTTRLQQVFWNLLKNAFKFTPEGGAIQVRSHNEDGQIAIEISDTGIGIDPATLPHIFEAFQQGDDSIARKYGGLGLGLAICKAILDAHQGSIVASSKGSGKGATFTVRLPLLKTKKKS